MPKCPICDAKLRHRKDGLFECRSCQFVGDSARVLRTKILKNKGEARLRELDGERELLQDALQVLNTQGNELPLKEVINAIDSSSSQNPVPTLVVRHNSRRKYLLMLASIEIMAFADWFLTNSGSLVEGRVTALQAAFPFTFLLIGAILCLMAK